MRTESGGGAEAVEKTLIPLADPDRCYELRATVCYDEPWGWKPLDLLVYRQVGFANSVRGYDRPLPAAVCRRWRESELFTEREAAEAKSWLYNNEPVLALNRKRLLALSPSAMPWTSTCPADGDHILKFWRRSHYNLPLRLEAFCNWNQMHSHGPTRDRDFAIRSASR